MRKSFRSLIKSAACITAALVIIGSTAFAYADEADILQPADEESLVTESVQKPEEAAFEPEIFPADGAEAEVGDEDATEELKPIEDKDAALEYSSAKYTGSPLEPAVTVEGLEAGIDFIAEYASNVNVGKAKVTITGIGEYTGKLVRYFKIVPARTKITGFVPDFRAFEVSWSVQPEQTSGYVLRYSSDAEMAAYKTIFIENPQASSRVISSLKVNQKYYVKLRTYAVVDGAKYYSEWGPQKCVRTYKKYTVLKTLSKSRTPKAQKISGKTSKFCPQSMAYLGSGNYVIAYSNTSQGDTEQYLKKYVDGKAALNKRAYLGHANGLCYNPNTKLLYSVRGSSDLVRRYNTTLEKKSDKHLSITLSGLAYDRKTGNYYASRANEIFVLDKNFNVVRRINKIGTWRYAQDVGGYNGYIYSCVCLDKNRGKNRINIYKASNGQYIGTYEVNWNEHEIEDCEVDEKGRLLILMNIHHTGTDYVFRTMSSLAR